MRRDWERRPYHHTHRRLTGDDLLNVALVVAWTLLFSWGLAGWLEHGDVISGKELPARELHLPMGGGR